MNQPSHTVILAGGNDVLGAERVCLVKQLPRSPDSRNGGGVKNGIDAGACLIDGSGIANVSLDALDAERLQLWIAPTRQDPHTVTACDKLFDNVAAEETPAAGYERQHRKPRWPVSWTADLEISERTSTERRVTPGTVDCLRPIRESLNAVEHPFTRIRTFDAPFSGRP
jgi:hypothetical protein